MNWTIPLLTAFAMAVLVQVFYMLRTLREQREGWKKMVIRLDEHRRLTVQLNDALSSKQTVDALKSALLVASEKEPNTSAPDAVEQVDEEKDQDGDSAKSR